MNWLIMVIALSAFVVAFKNKENKKRQTLIVPEVNFEFSGGAGHYDYAPSVIRDEYGIRYAFVCENKEPFKIVDYV